MSGDVSIAYQVEGEGPALVMVGNWGHTIEAFDATLEIGLWYQRLAAATRFVMIDARGSGLSARGAIAQNLDVWVQDVKAVLDAIDLHSAVLVTQDLSGPIAIAFAARHPARVDGLVLMGTFARLFNGAGYTAGVDASLREFFIDET